MQYIWRTHHGYHSCTFKLYLCCCIYEKKLEEGNIVALKTECLIIFLKNENHTRLLLRAKWCSGHKIKECQITAKAFSELLLCTENAVKNGKFCLNFQIIFLINWRLWWCRGIFMKFIWKWMLANLEQVLLLAKIEVHLNVYRYYYHNDMYMSVAILSGYQAVNRRIEANLC